jgi:hypothetical protein
MFESLAMRQRFASKPPPAVAFMGRFGFEAPGCSAVRLLGRLIARCEQLPGLRSVGRAEALGSSGDFVSRVKVATRAAKHSESFLHDLGSNA